MSEELQSFLSVARLPASPDEVAAYATVFATIRSWTDALYDLPETKYVDPALRFSATARIDDWSDEET